MGWWRINTDSLAESRFVVSALAEATASLLTLERGTATHPGERAWLDVHQTAYRKLLTEDPVTALLVRGGFGRGWMADFLTPTPLGEGEPAFAEELLELRRTPSDDARADLAVSLRGPLPGELDRPDLPDRAADLLEWVWNETVLPYWPRRRRIIEADIVVRAQQLTQGGWAAALDDLRPGMRWLGDGRLQINAYRHPPQQISGAKVLFVPVTSRHCWVSWDKPRRYAVTYPCSGPLVEADRAPVPRALRALLGAARADLLVLLDTPKSTTHLVALTGQALGSVGRHLKVLLDARLVWRRRAGRSVLYYRTDAGECLVEAQKDC